MNTSVSTTQFMTGLRYVLFFAGTWLATHGYIQNQDVNGLVSGLLIILPPIWAWIDNYLKARNAKIQAAINVNAGMALMASGKGLAADGKTVVAVNDGKTPPALATLTTTPEIIKDFAPHASAITKV